jgi:hypothetical protein
MAEKTLYRLRFYDTAGVIQYELSGSAQADPGGLHSGFLSLGYVVRVNAPGMISFAIRGDHELLQDIEDKWYVQVDRKMPGLEWNRELVGLYRYGQWNWGERGPIFSAQCPGYMHKLSWRHVLWPAGTEGRSYFTNDDVIDIASNLVFYNAGTVATVANGRYREGSQGWLAPFQFDAGNLKKTTLACHGDNVLETIQILARVTGDDFEVTPRLEDLGSGYTKSRPETAVFKWHNGQLGTDLTSTLVFSMQRGNMANPIFRDNRIGEATVGFVGGPGEEDVREYEIVEGDDYAAGNDIETFINATDIKPGDATGLEERGAQKLKELKATKEFEFTAIDTVTRIGEDYVLGDLATAINPYNGDSYTVKCFDYAVSLDAETGDEVVSPSWRTL